MRKLEGPLNNRCDFIPPTILLGDSPSFRFPLYRHYALVVSKNRSIATCEHISYPASSLATLRPPPIDVVMLESLKN